MGERFSNISSLGCEGVHSTAPPPLLLRVVPNPKGHFRIELCCAIDPWRPASDRRRRTTTLRLRLLRLVRHNDEELNTPTKLLERAISRFSLACSAVKWGGGGNSGRRKRNVNDRITRKVPLFELSRPGRGRSSNGGSHLRGTVR